MKVNVSSSPQMLIVIQVDSQWIIFANILGTLSGIPHISSYSIGKLTKGSCPGVLGMFWEKRGINYK